MGSLWSFATQFYSRPGIEQALLGLQDEDGLDVPLLITLLYAGRRGFVLAQEPLQALRETAAAWQSQAIAPLRQARRALKSPLGGAAEPAQSALRAQVKAAELAAERVLLGRLEALLPLAEASEPRTAIRSNLDAYVTGLPQPLSGAGRAGLARLAEEAAAR